MATDDDLLDGFEPEFEDNKNFAHVSRNAKGTHFRFSDHPPDSSVRLEKLDPGAYEGGYVPMAGLILQTFKFKHTKIITTPDSPSDKIMKFVRQNFSPETQERLEKYGEMNKNGILLHGPGGTGKSYTIYAAIHEAVKEGWIVLIEPDPSEVHSIIEEIRNLPKQSNDQPVMVIWEELDTLVKYKRNQLLNFLDGKTSKDHTLVLATTNHFNEIPQAFHDRPSRFSMILELASASEPVRRGYYEARMHPADREKWLEKMVADTAGFTIDNCKSLMLRVLAYGHDYKEVLADLRSRSKTKPLTKKVEDLYYEDEEAWTTFIEDVTARLEGREPPETSDTTPPTRVKTEGLRGRVKGLLEALAE